MSDPQTMRALLEIRDGGSPAIGAPGRDYLDYGGFVEHVDHTVASLNDMGLGRGDRVAIVLPNGPEMASAFVSLAAGTTTAPLNPGYRRKEYDFYLDDLGARALIVESGSESEARRQRTELGPCRVGDSHTRGRAGWAIRDRSRSGHGTGTHCFSGTRRAR